MWGAKAEDIQIGYIGGGSRGWAWGLMRDLSLEESLSGTILLYDIDYQAALDNEKIGNSLYDREDVLGKWRYKAVRSLKEALTGSDFVIASIEPGTHDEKGSDIHTPEAYGIYQSVGDTVGPGGLIRALRTIPMYVEIAEAIKKYAPEAWVINYTNPMTLCTRALYAAFPKIKAFGCCHEVFGTQKLLAAMLKDLKGIENVVREEIKVNVLGINHFTWLNKATYQNMDLFPLYSEFVDKYYEEGFVMDKFKDEGDKIKKMLNSCLGNANRVKFDLFKRYGLIAASGDRHLAEFVPGSWYLKDPETVKEWKFALTHVSVRIAHQNSRYEKSRKLLSGEEKFELNPTGEDGVRQIKALVGLADIVSNVNMPNTGQMSGVPLGAVVETNAVFRANEIKPVNAGQLRIR